MTIRPTSRQRTAGWPRCFPARPPGCPVPPSGGRGHCSCPGGHDGQADCGWTVSYHGSLARTRAHRELSTNKNKLLVIFSIIFG